jgi:murein hydrolase activator
MILFKKIGSIVLFLLPTVAAFTQTRGELEKQKLAIKKEIDEAQKMLNSNKALTNKNLTTLYILSNKANLQERVVNTVEKDINILDNSIVGIQREINKYDRLLDTLRREYAKSMVYAYKNRGNYEFLNFVFSANSFNDAIRRVAYLKSYRTFREVQGQNILRMQELRYNRLEELGVTKRVKNETLEVKTEEMKKLEEQKQEQDKIVAQLKREGKDLNARIAEKQRLVAKVDKAIKAAIAKAIAEEAAREKERRRIALEAKKEADRQARIKKEREDAAARAAAKAAAEANKTTTVKGSTNVKVTTPEPSVEPRKAKEAKVPEPVILADESVALNSSFERNRGSLPWPVDNPAILAHYGRVVLPNNVVINNGAVSIAASIGANVKAVFEGTVILVMEVEEGRYTVTLKHGNYYTSYDNLSNVTVKKEDQVKTGQVIGKVRANIDGVGTIDFYTAKGNSDLNPEQWLRRR